MVHNTGSLKHLDDRGTLWLIKNGTIFYFYSRHIWKVDITSFQMSYVYVVALWLSGWLNSPIYGSFEGQFLLYLPFRSNTNSVGIVHGAWHIHNSIGYLISLCLEGLYSLVIMIKLHIVYVVSQRSTWWECQGNIVLLYADILKVELYMED